MMLTYAYGDDERLYLPQRDGTVKLVKASTGETSVFLDISHLVLGTGGERGLYGMAMHPDYVENGRFWLHFASPGGTDHFGVIQEFRRDPNNPDLADPEPVHPPTLRVDHFASNHNGGSIEFSPIDRMLYVGMGDGGGGYDPWNNGTNRGTLLGALLRIDVSPTDGSYISPAHNAPNGAPEVFDWGLRNPFRWSFDICTGARYIGDVGQVNWEEIDVAPASQGATNWGWDCREGAHPLEPFGVAGPAPGCPFGDEVDPVWDYPHTDQLPWAVMGGYVYRGDKLPWLRGAYLFADFQQGPIWRTWWRGSTLTASDIEEIANLGVGITGFGQDNRGEVYVVWGGGTLYRLDPG
ncbi:MAG: PQQ-dependent sugar dehydrogenase [Polyangiaceae bacterium]